MGTLNGILKFIFVIFFCYYGNVTSRFKIVQSGIKSIFNFIKLPVLGAIVVVWLLDLQLPVQSVPITTNVVSSNPAYDQDWCTQYNIM